MGNQGTNLTCEGQQNLKKELGDLVNIRRNEVAAHIHKASEAGGTVDNAEYEDAKNEQAFVEGRISDIESILSSAIVASKSDCRENGAVGFGSSVILITDEGSKKSYTVVGSAEAAPLRGRISVESPVGRALIGHKGGGKVNVETPSRLVKLAIVKIA